MSVEIGFQQQSADSPVAIWERQPLAEHEQVLVWDQYYALVLHGLPDRARVGALRAALEGWAGEVIGHILEPVERLQGQRIPGAPLPVEADPGDCVERYAIEVQRSPQDPWPVVRVAWPEQPDGARVAASVLALAQYFLNKNPLFAKDLALHVFAFRKYYEDVAPPEDERSVAEAPGFVLTKAMKFFEEMSKQPPSSGCSK